MDLSALRGLVLDLNFSALGLPAIVARPNADPVSTRVIWLTQTSPFVPGGFDLQRVEPRRVLAVPRDDVPDIPRGTLIQAAEHTDPATIKSWQVDGVEFHDVDHLRVIVVPVEES